MGRYTLSSARRSAAPFNGFFGCSTIRSCRTSEARSASERVRASARRSRLNTNHCSLAVLVQDGLVAPNRQECLDGRAPAVPRCEMERAVAAVVDGIDVDAVLDEGPGRGTLVVRNGPVERSPPLVVNHIRLSDRAKVLDGLHIPVARRIEDRIDLGWGSLLRGRRRRCRRRSRRHVPQLLSNLRQKLFVVHKPHHRGHPARLNLLKKRRQLGILPKLGHFLHHIGVAHHRVHRCHLLLHLRVLHPLLHRLHQLRIRRGLLHRLQPRGLILGRLDDHGRVRVRRLPARPNGERTRRTRRTRRTSSMCTADGNDRRTVHRPIQQRQHCGRRSV